MASIAGWCCFVGFDYHDCFVQVCILDAAGEVLGNQRVANDMTRILEYVDNTRDGRVIQGAAVETSRDRFVRSFRLRQAIGSLLCGDSEECLQRQTSGRRRVDQSRESHFANDVDRSGSSVSPLSTNLETNERKHEETRETGVGCRGRGGQSLDPETILGDASSRTAVTGWVDFLERKWCCHENEGRYR